MPSSFFVFKGIYMAFHLKSKWTNPGIDTKVYKTLCLLLRPNGTHWKESGYSLIIFNNHLEYLRVQCGYDILKMPPKKWRIIGRLPYFLGIDQYEDYLCKEINGAREQIHY